MFLFSLKGFKAFMPINMAILPRNLEDYKPPRGRNPDVTGLIGLAHNLHSNKCRGGDDGEKINVVWHSGINKAHFIVESEEGG
ncbi:MAG: hypothetical protein ACOX2B_10445 [Syntrophothermaceae bacterium]